MTLVDCERLFSVANKNILTDTRKSTSPATFEAIIPLKMNQLAWDVYTMGRAMGRTAGDSFGTGGGDISTSTISI